MCEGLSPHIDLMKFLKSLYMNQYQIEFADSGLQKNALRFGDFTLKSGRPSTYFWTAGNGYSDGQGALAVARAHAYQIGNAMREGTRIDILHGPATKGFILVGTSADELYKGGTNIRFCHDMLKATATLDDTLEALKDMDIEVVETMPVTGNCFSGESAREFSKEFGDKLRAAVNDTGATFVLGEAHNGIIPAALMAKELYDIHGINVRLGYNRPVPKDKGDPKERYLVGDLRRGDRVIVVESQCVSEPPVAGPLKDGDHVALVDDVVTTGDTKITGWDILTGCRNGLTCAGVFIQLDRQETLQDSNESAVEMLERVGMPVYPILRAREMVSHYYREGKVTEEQMESFRKQQAEFGAKLLPGEEPLVK